MTDCLAFLSTIQQVCWFRLPSLQTNRQRDSSCNLLAQARFLPAKRYRTGNGNPRSRNAFPGTPGILTRFTCLLKITKVCCAGYPQSRLSQYGESPGARLWRIPQPAPAFMNRPWSIGGRPPPREDGRGECPAEPSGARSRDEATTVEANSPRDTHIPEHDGAIGFLCTVGNFGSDTCLLPPCRAQPSGPSLRACMTKVVKTFSEMLGVHPASLRCGER